MTIANVLDIDLLAGVHQADGVAQLRRAGYFLVIDLDDDVINAQASILGR